MDLSEPPVHIYERRDGNKRRKVVTERRKIAAGESMPLEQFLTNVKIASEDAPPTVLIAFDIEEDHYGSTTVEVGLIWERDATEEDQRRYDEWAQAYMAQRSQNEEQRLRQMIERDPKATRRLLDEIEGTSS